MPDEATFEDFLRRIRSGDAEATTELVGRYGPAIRLEAKLRLGTPGLRRALDPEDVCQSVLASFFVRAAAGQYDLDRPEQLIHLLITMARNKVAEQARRRQALRRDERREAPLDAGTFDPAASGPSPSRIVAGREVLEELHRRLSADERQIADLRGQGENWAEIARALGGTAEGRRKQMARAADRVCREIGLDEADDA